ncbi:MAG: PEGA domain-containing protein [Candidatus Saccharimonadaceae bacterium]
MFKKPTKKQFIIRRILLSSVATLSVVIIATVTILFMLGFRLDSDNGRLEQGALLQFDSAPNGADVYVDGSAIGTRTATKQTVIAGTHTIKMTKSGYQDWNRTVDLAAGTLTWLDYSLLVPKERPVQTVTTYQTLVGLTVSPDNKWVLAQEKADVPTFQVVDIRSEEVKNNNITLPEASYSEPSVVGVTHSFSIVSWDSGSRFVLIKHLYRDQTEWLVVDTQNVASTINVTQLLSVGFKDLQFAGTSGKELYGLTNDGAIRKIDLSAATLSRAFVTHVDSFSTYDNTTLSYIGVDPNDATKRVAGVYRDGDEASHILRSITSSDMVLKITASRYFSDDYVAIAEGNTVTILKGSYPSSSSQDNSSLAPFATLELSGAVSSLSFSPKGYYIVAQSGETFKSYEIEHTRADVGTIPTTAGKAVSTLKWLDIAHLWNDDNGTLTMRDFNGINAFAIMTVEPGFSASLSQNGRFFYAVGKNDTGYHLQRVKMILE